MRKSQLRQRRWLAFCKGLDLFRSVGHLQTIGPDKDPREVLADWMTSPENPFFAKVMANRVWAEIMGRGLVEPVDDLRDTNPPSNPALMDALAEHFVASGFDIHQLIRTITASRSYQRSSRPNETNQEDEQNYSRALL